LDLAVVRISIVNSTAGGHTTVVVARDLCR